VRDHYFFSEIRTCPSLGVINLQIVKEVIYRLKGF
jgi:hypothetical protein